MHSVIKSMFYIAFIIISLYVGTTMFTKSNGEKSIKLFGFMVLFLGIGESFHIVPRVLDIFSFDIENIQQYIDTGRFIASISIILVYLILIWLWKVYYEVNTTKNFNIILYLLAIGGVILSLVLMKTDNSLLILLRNIPTLIIGFIIILSYKKLAVESNKQVFKHLWIAVLLGLVFTLGFELLSPEYSLFIILMMPKTLVYIWLVLMGYIGYKKELFQT